MLNTDTKILDIRRIVLAHRTVLLCPLCEKVLTVAESVFQDPEYIIPVCIGDARNEHDPIKRMRMKHVSTPRPVVYDAEAIIREAGYDADNA